MATMEHRIGPRTGHGGSLLKRHRLIADQAGRCLEVGRAAQGRGTGGITGIHVSGETGGELLGAHECSGIRGAGARCGPVKPAGGWTVKVRKSIVIGLIPDGTIQTSCPGTKDVTTTGDVVDTDTAAFGALGRGLSTVEFMAPTLVQTLPTTKPISHFSPPFFFLFFLPKVFPAT